MSSPSGPAITNIIVLMLENRSYDNVLGWLYNPGNKPPYNQAPPGQLYLNGLTGKETNPSPVQCGEPIPVMNQTTTSDGKTFAGGFLVNDLLTFAHTTLYTQLSKPTVIYVHCDSGVNRTGTFVVLYLLTYGSSMYGPVATLEDAYNFADQMVPNNTAPVSTYFPMIQQYCLTINHDGKLGCDYTPPS
jgi:hypothetical protein